MQASSESPRNPRPTVEVLRAEDMVGAANDLLRSYLKLIERGHQQQAIAEAMLGATINLFDVLDLSAELPVVLRAVAERIERGSTLS